MIEQPLPSPQLVLKFEVTGSQKCYDDDDVAFTQREEGCLQSKHDAQTFRLWQW